VHDSAELGHSVALAVDGDIGLGETAAKFTAVSISLHGLPCGWGEGALGVWLTVVLKHLSDGVSAALTDVEVFKGDGAGDVGLFSAESASWLA